MGTLYIVSTPIGNLEDITLRAKKTLSIVDCILAEDTRMSKKLLNHLSLSKPLKSYHDFNKEKVTPGIITSLKGGSDFALISDAGTPGIADPAFYLIRRAIAEQIPIIPIPGPTALISALVASGLPTDRFIFENFLPSNSTKRKKVLRTFSNEKRTVLFYESPHRIVKVLQDMDEIFGDIRIVIARELTKLYEEFLRGTPRSLLEHFNNKKPKGEITVVFNAYNKNKKGE
jgi:16S rRNA (cytidine1402-2'-O)-methyltransferase